jgi:hypothetical protein
MTFKDDIELGRKKSGATTQDPLRYAKERKNP